jgi:preprotein translocase subunit SecY
LPEILARYASVPFLFGGPALLVAVCAILDVGAQFRAERRLPDAGCS